MWPWVSLFTLRSIYPILSGCSSNPFCSRWTITTILPSSSFQEFICLKNNMNLHNPHEHDIIGYNFLHIPQTIGRGSSVCKTDFISDVIERAYLSPLFNITDRQSCLCTKRCTTMTCGTWPSTLLWLLGITDF